MKENTSPYFASASVFSWGLVQGGLALALTGWVLLTTGWGQSAPPATTRVKQPSYSARITQVDTEKWPDVRVYVSITDQQGDPLSDDQSVSLALSENGRLMKTDTISQGKTLSSVLVLDLSGSMRGEKMEKAREAAVNYIQIASPAHQIAVVGFSNPNDVRSIGTFTDSHQTLINRINGLAAGDRTARTALQDGVGAALDLLKNQPGRKAIVALSDGKENASQVFAGGPGLFNLLEMAKTSKSTIFTIGLMDNDNHDYLKSYEMTGGRYLFSPSPEELKKAFAVPVKLLEKERELGYTSNNPNRDGIAQSLSVELKVGDFVSRPEKVIVVPPGVIPHVRGSHTLYFVLILLLLYTPGIFGRLKFFFAVRRFRAGSIERLKPGSPCLELRDPNIAPTEPTFAVGDMIVRCPTCTHPHYIRSWRNNKCCCMKCHYLHATAESGNYCYTKKFPRWLRYFLDSLAERKKIPERGRSYLCYCAGDKDGY